MPGSGRFLDGKPLAAVAKLNAVEIFSATSEEMAGESGKAQNVLEGQPAAFWHTSTAATNPPIQIGSSSTCDKAQRWAASITSRVMAAPATRNE